MQTFQETIHKLPMTPLRFRTIQLETLTQKKELENIPKKIVESIKHNVAKTIDNETKALKDEIARLVEILEE